MNARRICSSVGWISLVVGCEPPAAGPITVANTRPAVASRTSRSTTTATTRTAADAAAEGDVWEAAVRYGLDVGSPTTRQTFDAYYVSIGGHDPSAAFLARFAGQLPPVLAGSEATVALDGVSGRKPGGHGLSVTLGDPVTWIDHDTAEVEVGRVVARLAAGGFRYRLERRDGKWTVTKQTPTCIS